MNKLDEAILKDGASTKMNKKEKKGNKDVFP
jgi:hypothetical protein